MLEGMERRKNEKRAGGRVHLERGGGRSPVDEEDYGDYVTRCICEFKHDDGYMICCDECSVWQHIECMQVDPGNLPENYLCELCEPRLVDKRRAQKIQLKKREDISDAEEKRKRHPGHSPLPHSPLSTVSDSKKPSSLLSSSSAASTPGLSAMAKKRKKKGKAVAETKGDGVRKSKRERSESSSTPAGGQRSESSSTPAGGQKKQRKRAIVKGAGHLDSSSSIQSLLNAASLLEGEDEQGMTGKVTPMRRKSDLWNGERSPWTNKYETADQNLYTEPVRAFLVSHMEQLKVEEVVYSREEYLTTMTHPHPQCVLAEVALKRKGVLAQQAVPQDELVMECKGKIAVKQDILSDLVTGSRTSSLWKHKPCPFVYLFDKIANLDLCIDSRNYGNLTRFIRRSCFPNAEIRHFFVCSELHFGVYAVYDITQDEEVTLPFDFRYDKCDYPVECACGQSQTVCLVARGKHPAAASRPLGGVTIDEEYHSSRNQSSTLQRSHSHVFLPQDEDSNSSWTSVGSASRKRPRLSGPSSFKSQSSCGPSCEVSSDSEEEAEKHHRKQSLSREERKTEQVWRVFEKMEASAQRRRQQLLSEGSHESDPLSSPTPLHPLSTKLLKDRRPSSSSSSARNKAQMLPGVKMRLSSVSSTDPLSPYEPCEPFSPPTTPGLVPPADLRSPLLSPSSPTPHYPAVPQLHPKYLFTEVALPWKKAILQQWEREQGLAPNPPAYWPHSDILLDPHVPVVTKEMLRPRVRGTLKHRLLKRYNEEQASNQAALDHAASNQDDVPTGSTRTGSSSSNASGSDKENAENDEMRMWYKKRVLLRWQRSNGVVEESSPGPSPPPPGVGSEALPSSKDAADPTQEGVVSGRGSPLFEEFSDSDEFMEHHSALDRHGDTAGTALSAMEPVSPGPPPEDRTPMSTISGPNVGGASPDVEKDGVVPRVVADESLGSHDESPGSHDPEEAERDRNLSGVSDISSESMSREPLITGPKTPPPPSRETTPSSGPAAGVSDISSDNMESCSVTHSADVSISGTIAEAESSGTPCSSEEVGEGVATPTGPPTAGHYDVVEGGVAEPASTVGDADSKEEGGWGVGGDGESFVGGAGGIGSQATPPEMEYEGAVPRRPPPLESLTGGVVAPPSPPSTQGTPSKTPGKRKITYTEYRSRARKPFEKKPFDKVSHPSSPPPPTTPGTPSFLAHSFFASSAISALPSYSSTLQLTSVPLVSISPTPGPGEPHFEPVSPEDGDHTPKLLGSHDGERVLGPQPLM